jgi:molecular chaperone HtpG
MKEMAQLQSGMSFYSDMPDMYSMVLNTDHPLVKNVLADVNVKVDEALKPIENELRGLNARRMAIEQSQKDMKAEDISQEEKDDLNNCREAILAEESKKAEVLKTYAETNALIPQLIDLALLQNGLLKGEALNNFIKRSIEICGK